LTLAVRYSWQPETMTGTTELADQLDWRWRNAPSELKT